jgi:acetyltransferase-like isoleucine patch superfamily enzyme
MVLVRIKKWAIARLLGNRPPLTCILVDRIKFMLLKKLYYTKFKYYGRNVRWGKNGDYKCIPKSVRINCHEKIEIGDNVQIDENVFIQMHNDSPGIKIGDGTRINQSVHIQAYSKITIGKNVLIAPNTLISSSDHGFKNLKPIMFQKQNQSGEIKIGKGVWLGRNSSILGGVEVPNFSVLGCNSVLTKTFKEPSVLAGVPAKLIRRIIEN